jgi:hypothetical protein
MIATKERVEPIVTAAEMEAAYTERMTGVGSGKLEYLTAGDIQIDTRYQRGLFQPKVKKIVADFDPDAFGVLVVSRRADGSLWALDGQHRLAALQQMEWLDQRVPCVVYDGLTLEQEAKIFYLPQMTRRPLTPAERFRARLVQGERVALEIQAIANRYGYTVNTTNGGTGSAHTLDAVAAVELLHTDYADGGILARVLEITSQSWGNDEYHISGEVLRGIGAFTHRFPQYDHGRLVSLLRSIRPDAIDNDGKDIQRLLGMNKNYSSAYAIHRLYNRRMKTNRLPDWDDGRKGRTRDG